MTAGGASSGASYTSKYVGVLEGDLGVLSVKIPLKSLKELHQSSDGSTVHRPGSAPGGARGPATSVSGMGSRGPAPFGHASAGAIVHGSFAPRALRGNSHPRRPPATAGQSRRPTVERNPMAAKVAQTNRRPNSAASFRSDQLHLVHNAISGFRLTTPAARLSASRATQQPPQQLRPWVPTAARAPSPAKIPAQHIATPPTSAPYDMGPAGPAYALDHSWARAAPPSPPRMPLSKTSVGHAPELYLQYCKIKMSMGQ